MSFYIGTWIGKKNKISQKDYNREMNRPGDIFFWDDTRQGHAVEGGFFVFIDATESVSLAKLKVFKIIKINRTHEERLKEWSNYGYTTAQNYDTSKRNLLTIEKKCLKEITWNEYSNNVNYKAPLRLTQSLRYSFLLETKSLNDIDDE